ncbi:unnamed protein product (macronuclear) [Paramecium tetraurelia]|uniref:Transmembrane protein n=1 Tax=Paramecium tetraurelia TaxID=5888 RepID=A0C4M3_PARTE|nr:uncharacterized protein GSPATT00006239001 [Paramecium tetraurelia]CAK65740.1 unnamed protein product [Paramecium tetraurelia]|eukprot:XP_001433137.1 hypothetical protein (macronuclear) [Paramecium tetraurelia strain d4-2]
MDGEMPCQYDGKNKTCSVDITEQITCKGFNLQACRFYTPNLLCEFDQNEKKCQSSFGYSKCTDYVNKQKCLAIITNGQFCEFDDNKGCNSITNLDLIKKCDPSRQTNPITCSQSTDIPCFYNKASQTCIEYSPYKYIDNLDNIINNSNDRSYLNYVISNIYSLNEKACELFNFILFKQDSGKLSKRIVKLQWFKGACVEIKEIQQINRLSCDNTLNLYGCVLIKTKFQYCHFKDNKCEGVDYRTYSNQKCTSIQLINNGAFCAQTTDVKCQYDSQSFSCIEVPENATIECDDNDPNQKGYNQKACESNPNCIFKESCFKKTEISQNRYCYDAIDLKDCLNVKLEGCKINNGKCVRITNQDYKEIKCDQAQNQIGCTNIQTVGQNCQYLENKCIEQKLIQMRTKKCKEINNVNNLEFCQQPKDTECAYDFQDQSCKEVSDLYNLTCSQGINRKACLKLINKDLKNCSYLDYCFGPNQIDEQCGSQNEACRRANSIETCLFQSYCKCQWQNNTCQSSSINATSVECDDLEYASVAVCNQIENCNLSKDPIDAKKFICKTIQPTTCEEMQSRNQCSRMISLPCIWNEMEQYCMYLEIQEAQFGQMSSSSMNCEDITIQNGSQRACMNIVKQGQMCIFQDNQCNAFVQDQTQNNCLNNINVNSCLQQKVSDCYWEVKLFKVKKTLEGTESEQNYGSCVKFDKFDNYDKQVLNDCDSKLSYTSCLKIIREGVFCRWQNNQCQLIDDNEVIIFQPSSLKEVNHNACGLVNNGDIVKYDQNMNFCIQIQDHSSVTCVTEGLNKDACLNIKFQNCYWDITRRKCRLGKPALDNKQNSCQFKNLSSYLCSQLKLDQPCGFIKDGCDFVDLDQITCNHEGLNQYACLHVKNYPCIWTKQNDEKYQCEDYSYYLPCDQIPSNVNSKVCSIIREGACYYNEQNFKCEIPNKNQTSCELNGLNIIGCVQIENCYYDQKCQHLNKNNYLCEEFPIANQFICKNAIDSCKYYEFQYGCQVAQNEGCSDESLSDQGCLNQPNCVLQADGCKCRKFIETYDCTQITDIDKCKLQNHCIVQYQQISQIQLCTLKKCQDYFSDQCDGKSILKSICYWSHSNQCLPAQNCEDILQPFYECSKYKFNNKPCQENKNFGKCEEFNCQNFGQEQCLEYQQFCTFNKTCQIKQCSDYLMENCIINGCEWNKKLSVCYEQIDCSNFVERVQCNGQYYNSKPCHWVINNSLQICTQYKCSSLQQSQSCSGTRIGSEYCVEISDSLCLSCEEISDSCDCLQQSKYCSYDIVKDKCISKSCESYLTQEECPSNFCTFVKQQCQTSCEFLQMEDQCQQIKQCEWVEKYNQCQKQCSYIQEEQKCLLVYLCSWDQDEQKCQKKKQDDLIIREIQSLGEIITSLIILNLIFV